jgi:anti-anti-sigma factor
MDPAATFAVEEPPAPDGVRCLLLRGELDMVAAAELRRRLDGAAGARGLVLDLGEAAFVDSAGLKELLRANQELEREGTRLVLASVPQHLQRLLDLTRTAELFAVAGDRDDALARLGA